MIPVKYFNSSDMYSYHIAADLSGCDQAPFLSLSSTAPVVHLMIGFKA
jgi:hypothetical protein